MLDSRARSRRLLADLDGRHPLAHVVPTWFAAVMGTGIVAVAPATLPVHVPGLAAAARVVWVLAAVLLVTLLAVTVGHWRTHPRTARAHLTDPATGWFYGAPAMALVTVGTGALLVGVPVVGLRAAVLLDAVLWTSGTLLGLATAVVVPFLALTRWDLGVADASGAWLMPVVPPMVSAATGPVLLPHLPPGQPRVTVLMACVAMFGLALLASLLVTGLLVTRLLRHGLPASAQVPTLWIVLGWLGQSVTAAHTLGTAASGLAPTSSGALLRGAALAYGLPVWGIALLWMSVAGAVTVRTARDGLPFTLSWWSFTFPVGTVVTGTSALAVETGAGGLAVLAGALYAALVVAWSVVATRTLRGAWRGTLLRAPA